jgi:hypothetical protein
VIQTHSHTLQDTRSHSTAWHESKLGVAQAQVLQIRHLEQTPGRSHTLQDSISHSTAWHVQLHVFADAGGASGLLQSTDTWNDTHATQQYAAGHHDPARSVAWDSAG